MAKISVHGGPSNAQAEPEPAVPAPDEVTEGGNGPVRTTLPETAGYASQTILELRALASVRGLPVRGSKAELMARLEEYDTQAGP